MYVRTDTRLAALLTNSLSGCAGQKDSGFVGVSACSTWPRGARKNGIVSLLFRFRLPFVDTVQTSEIPPISAQNPLFTIDFIFPQRAF